MFYEIIFETGNHSVAQYGSDEEARDAVLSHHNRALKGEKAQATNQEMGPAERVKKVLKYDSHPVDYTASQAAVASDVSAAVEEAINENKIGDLVSVPEVAAAVREISSPLVDSGPHESNYKMPESGELTGDWNE